MSGHGRTMWWETPMWYWADGQPLGADSVALLCLDRDAARVAVTAIRTSDGLVGISTLFTLSDMNYRREMCAQLWETVQLGGQGNRYQRYYSFADARAGHAEMVDEIIEALGAAGVDIISREDRQGEREHVQYVRYDKLDMSVNYHPAMRWPLHPEAAQILERMSAEDREALRASGYVSID
jgi:hypothetical protein